MDHGPPAPARSADAAAWIAPCLTGRFGAVTRTVPSGYEAYARIFHPADPGGPQTWRWADVATANNRTMHAVAQWSAISTTESGNTVLADVEDPPLGDLEPVTLRALVDLLQPHTPVTDCWFAMWQGWGDFFGGTIVTASPGGKPHESIKRAPAEWQLDLADAATFTTPGRDYFLFAGPLADVTRFGSSHTAKWYSPRSPNLAGGADQRRARGTHDLVHRDLRTSTPAPEPHSGRPGSNLACLLRASSHRVIR